MAGIAKTVLVPFGINAEQQNDAQLVYHSLTSVDAGPTDTGISVTSALNYQIIASNSWFSSVGAGSVAILVETSAFPGGLSQGLRGLGLNIINTGANYLQVQPHPNDPGATINLAASVTLQPNSINLFQCAVPGQWFVDGIGAGFSPNNSIETIASQGTITPAGTTNATATQITQAMVNVAAASASNTGIALPKAKAGTQVAVNFPGSGTTPIVVFPLNGSGDTINGAGSLSVTIPQATPAPIVFFCFNDGAWFTK